MAVADAFAIERSLPHGHVEAVLAMINKLGLDGLIASKRCCQRDLVLAMIACRLIHPASKLATTRLWRATTLAGELGVAGADEDGLYAAMDWLLRRQPLIEKKLAARYLADGALVLYDVTSSYYEGRTCPLMRIGYNRDCQPFGMGQNGKRGKTQVIYGLLADGKGRPLAVEAYAGNVGDAATVGDQVDKLKRRFGFKRVVLVGDRGMLTQARIEALKAHPGLGRISALRASAVRGLADEGALQLSLFDGRNIAGIASPAFPGGRLVACYNPLLADQRRRKREDPLAATERQLDKIVRQVRRRTRRPLDGAEIGRKVGAVINRFKMGKHFQVTMGDGVFAYDRRQASIRREAELDGIYVIRTSESGERLPTGDAVRRYKDLAHVERAFRCLKGVDVLIRPIRPIRHRDERRVRAHIFLCLLAYYVEWHLRKALAPLLFDDGELDAERKTRDPVAPAEPSASAKRKKALRSTPDGLAHTQLRDPAGRPRHPLQAPPPPQVRPRRPRLPTTHRTDPAPQTRLRAH